MTPETQIVKLSDIVFSEKSYPRKNHDPALAQKYATCLDEIESRNNFISVALDMELLDGRHRHLAYLSAFANDLDRTLPVYVYPVSTAEEKFLLALELNSTHGHQLSQEEKRNGVLQLYSKYHTPLETIARAVAVRKQMALDWTKGIREQEEENLNETIFNMWLGCATMEEIAEIAGSSHSTIVEKLRVLSEKFPGTKSTKLSKYDDIGDEDGFQVPLYNIWTFAKKTNEVTHFGNSEQRILDNLLYLYTEPFDIVVDPFAGGGSTIDVCKKRLRRYWASDRSPTVVRNDIRTLDVCQDLPPLNRRWSDVSLTYLDPPYWKQAEGKYSTDKEDLANMPLDEFTEKLASVVKGISKKQSHGVIALLIQPTQWNAENKQFTDHVTDLIKAVGNKRLVLENRVSCPYSNQQCTPQMVNWAKEHKKLLVLSRELIIWRINDAVTEHQLTF